MRYLILVFLLFSLSAASDSIKNQHVNTSTMERRVGKTMKLFLDSFFMVKKEALKAKGINKFGSKDASSLEPLNDRSQIDTKRK